MQIANSPRFSDKYFSKLQKEDFLMCNNMLIGFGLRFDKKLSKFGVQFCLNQTKIFNNSFRFKKTMDEQ